MNGDNYRHALQVSLDAVSSASGDANRKARTIMKQISLLQWRIERIERKIFGKSYDGNYPETKENKKCR